MDSDSRPLLAATIAPLGLPPRDALAFLSKIGIRGAAISATDRSTRPRELDRSARRDLVACMGRLELHCAAVDCFLPVAHFLDPAEVDRATSAAIGAIELAAEIASLEGRKGLGTVVLPLPASEEALFQATADAIAQASQHHGVRVAQPSADPTSVRAPFLVAIDPAQVLASGNDPLSITLAAVGKIGAVRIVDLLRSGNRGPIGEPQEAQLDLHAFVSACRAAGFTEDFVVDMRQWTDPRGGLLATLERWSAGVRL